MLNRSGHCHGFRFVTIYEKGADGSKDCVWAAAWPNKMGPPKKFVTSRPTERRLDPVHRYPMDIPIICYPSDEINHDPFNSLHHRTDLDSDATRVLGQVLAQAQSLFRFQHRTFCYVIVFFGCYARIVRVDRAGTTFSTSIDCTLDATHLINFLRHFSQASPADRGIDLTAEHVPHDSLLGKTMQRRAELNKHPNSPTDHPRHLFAQSLQEDWPWFKLSVGEGASRREFLVGRPLYERSGALPNTCSRGYIALDTNDPDQPLVFLKDMWRLSRVGYLPEGVTVARLNAAGVPHVPTLVCHGVVDGQVTLSDQLTDHETFASRVHYRIAVSEVGKPLDTFNHSKELLDALKCCIIAHSRAMEIPILHRDISDGNILLVWNPSLNKWEGMLTDWEIATDFTEACHYDGDPVLCCGTQVFAAVRVLEATRGAPEREAEDDLEGFLHVLLYLCLRYLSSNLQNISAFLQRYFHEDGFLELKRGSFRARCVQAGKIPISQSRKGPAMELRFALPSDTGERSMRRPLYTHPLNDVLRQLFEWLRVRYEVLPKMSQYRRYWTPKGSDSKTFTAQRIIDLLDAALQDPQWPVGDKREDRCLKEFKSVKIERTDTRMVLPDDVPIPRPKAHERPEVELPAAKRRRRA
ncbi:uncharacterized protein TRAVEDRAFT_52187 [Trametes versicolor FP-101664 SS1]|uniref:uncharacterized protein n=1 Tax=Trametes versicolor (strain FP-101664) TaxID=717944 RepID=UPI000462231B|nr:uncharacterized protein TRAVEDRAFT_52187 [Trametes versicolor FP-101664 SS1]EIW54482.1 hypothetical protein TRAVEDRAFT_52187 [Trametes versicolor FP-101664 SS1]